MKLASRILPVFVPSLWLLGSKENNKNMENIIIEVDGVYLFSPTVTEKRGKIGTIICDYREHL